MRPRLTALACLRVVVVTLVVVGPLGVSVSDAEPQAPPGCRAVAVTAAGEELDPAKAHASLSRTLPRALVSSSHQLEREDTDALSWHVVCAGLLPTALKLESERPGGGVLDVLSPVAVRPVPCPRVGLAARASPPGASSGAVQCGVTEPVRATVDDADRSHPEARAVSILAEVGGRLVAWSGETRLAAIPVGGPRATAVGTIERLRGTLRVHVVRSRPGGETPLGKGDRAALERIRREIEVASMVWGQCGIHFGPPAEAEVRLVDPPEAHLVSVGCELGLPASGGTIRLTADGKLVRVTVPAGATPERVAEALASAVRAAGLVAIVSPNARIAPGALPSVDVLVRRKNDGRPARLEAEPGKPLTTDATLGVCLGEVSFGDGLSHFDDLDASAGTLEERALVKAFSDGDPRTIEVFVIPSFASSGRIGESFIDEPGTAMKNVVIVDRAGIRAGSRSYALPHELGHVLLDLPGHPDDFGVDRPWALMDADATDGTIFGPRRLSIEDCERAVRQSGPLARVPLLTAWPLVREGGPGRDGAGR